jgi:hypothetical protein
VSFMVAELQPKQPTHRPAVSSKQTHVRLHCHIRWKECGQLCRLYHSADDWTSIAGPPPVSPRQKCQSSAVRTHTHTNTRSLVRNPPLTRWMGHLNVCHSKRPSMGSPPRLFGVAAPRWKGGIDRFARCRTSSLIASQEGFATGIQLSTYE